MARLEKGLGARIIGDNQWHSKIKKIGVNQAGKPLPHWHLVIIYRVKVHRLTPEIRLAKPYMELLWNIPSKMPSVTVLKLCCELINELCIKILQWTKYINSPYYTCFDMFSTWVRLTAVQMPPNIAWISIDLQEHEIHNDVSSLVMEHLTEGSITK